MTPFEAAQASLTEIQRRAVEWDKGPLLVLAGPGSGKTQVLTCRIARVLDSAKGSQFRVLALTFTNKASDEMKARVADFAPGLDERANVATFHGFCAQLLRQHGVHLGIKPDFAIYSSETDRRAVLNDALRRVGSVRPSAGGEYVNYLPAIDRLKSTLIDPAHALGSLHRATDPEEIVQAYDLYEQELRRANAMDFNSLLFEAYRLITRFPALAANCRRTYPYLLIDEFQDTNGAQYDFLKALAGDDWRNVFAVADDDQIIYEWNGASYRRIESFLRDFGAEVIQLPTNYRCPPAVVEAANRLVVYNAHRSRGKQPLVAGKSAAKFPPVEQIQVRVFDDADAETTGIAAEIGSRDRSTWGQTVVLARTRSLVESMLAALREKQIPSAIAQRRDEFLAPEFRWLVALLRQVTRPLDGRNLAGLVEASNRLAGIEVALDDVRAAAETSGRGYLSTWLSLAKGSNSDPAYAALLALAEPMVADPAMAKETANRICSALETQASTRTSDSDLSDDLAAWRQLSRDISGHIGANAPLEEFLQELQLRSKEPLPKRDTVTLMTIHGAKGREFDVVYVVGLAEDILPSFQSKQKGDDSLEMEEERRNCFVAITRTKERLVLSRAKSYRGWTKSPSRFLLEMGLDEATAP